MMVKVESGGTEVVAHVGRHALGACTDRLGLGDALSAAIPPRGQRMPHHDWSKVLTQKAQVLAGGGESYADIQHLRLQSTPFGSVPSDSTVFRAFLDSHATLVEIHSEGKEQAAPHFKGGYGFHPMFCFADATGEALSGVLRADNARSNTVDVHVALLDQAIAQLPEPISARHQVGGDANTVKRQLFVRSDSAGCSTGFLSACRERNVRFFVTARQNAQFTAAVSYAVGTEEL